MTPSQRSDRTVHAVRNDGVELVRYDRAGKWYIEHDQVRDQVTITDATNIARAWSLNEGKVFFGRAGGSRFDAKVRSER